MMPPTRWTPTTSSESSYPSLYFSPTASSQTAPAIRPSRIEVSGVRNAQAGVIATRPATAPEAAPTLVGRPSRSFSTTSQAPMAAAVATWVFMNAMPARLPAVSAEPALNPNHPNHSSPAPSSTNGTLCGRIGSLRNPIRLPRTRQRASAAAPALMWTAVPPAKSSTPHLASQPAPSKSGAPVPKSNTQCATGKYTSVAQIVMKIDQDMNFVRSAIEPEISAGVMIANINWKAAKTTIGILSVPVPNVAIAAAVIPFQFRWPHRPLEPASPKASLNPYRVQRMLMMQIVTNDIIIMLSVLLARVTPPEK